MTLNKSALVISALLGLTLTQQVFADVSGMVYQDLPVNGTTLNTYGVKDSNELGVADVTVTAYQVDGTSQTMVTADDGLWTLATTNDVRVEFSTIPSYLKESPDGDVGNSSVQLVANGGVVDFGLHDPSNFIGANPSLSTTHFINGKENPNAGALPTLFKWDLSNVGGVNANQEILADTSVARSLWGLAFNRAKQELYSATVLRRHSSTGSNGLGVIYSTDLTTNITTQLIDIPNVGIIGDDVSRELNDAADRNTDAEAFAKVAKVGLGDIEISEDGKILYVINLNDKKIYEIDLVNKVLQTSYDTPIPACINGENRPFGLDFYQGSLYIGSVCDASLSTCDTSINDNCAELKAHVFKIKEGETTGSEVFSLRLDYDKPQQAPSLAVYAGSAKNWNPWTDNYSDLINEPNKLTHPVPILSAIEFDEVGNMFLGFIDRTGLQGGAKTNDINGVANGEEFTFSAGDILKATLNGDGSFSVTNHNLLDDQTAEAAHTEGALGAVKYIKGSGELIFTEYDNVEVAATNTIYTKGVTFLNSTTGAEIRSYRVADYNRPTFFGKSAGIGDIEILTEPAPIEIGNRIWGDTDGDGVQDAGELGIASVSIELFCGGASVSTATTDVNGYYIFSNDLDGVSTNSHKYNVTALVAGIDTCLVRIPNISGGSKQAALGANNLTTANTGEGASSNQNDSDGIASGDNAEANITAAEIRTAGANNHSFDFGFSTVSVPVGCVTVNNTASITAVNETDTDASNDTATASIDANCVTPEADLELVKTADKIQVLKGDTLIYTLTLTNKGGSDATDIEVTDTLPVNVTFVSATAPVGSSFDDTTKVWTIPSLPAVSGSNVLALQIQVTVN